MKVFAELLSKEIGWLAKGVAGRVTVTKTIEFIHKEHEVPCDKQVTYANMVCDYWPLKTEPMQVHLTVGRDCLPYTNDAGSLAATLLEAKLMLKSTISDADKGACFFATDLKDFFLATPMDEPEYMRLHSKYFFDDIKSEYDIYSKLASNGYVYIRINKGMYRLKQAAVLAYNQLVTNLSKMAMPHVLPQLAFGNTEHAKHGSVFVLTILGLRYSMMQTKLIS